MSNTSVEHVPVAQAGGSDAKPGDFELEDYRSMRGITVSLTVELARRSISVEELLRLQVDDVLVFSRPTGENVDLYAADVLFGNAEILGTEEKLAVRITELLDLPKSVLSQPPNEKPTRSLALLESSSDEN